MFLKDVLGYTVGAFFYLSRQEWNEGVVVLLGKTTCAIIFLHVPKLHFSSWLCSLSFAAGLQTKSAVLVSSREKWGMVSLLPKFPIYIHSCCCCSKRSILVLLSSSSFFIRPTFPRRVKLSVTYPRWVLDVVCADDNVVYCSGCVSKKGNKNHVGTLS